VFALVSALQRFLPMSTVISTRVNSLGRWDVVRTHQQHDRCGDQKPYTISTIAYTISFTMRQTRGLSVCELRNMLPADNIDSSSA